MKSKWNKSFKGCLERENQEFNFLCQLLILPFSWAKREASRNVTSLSASRSFLFPHRMMTMFWLASILASLNHVVRALYVSRLQCAERETERKGGKRVTFWKCKWNAQKWAGMTPAPQMGSFTWWYHRPARLLLLLCSNFWSQTWHTNTRTQIKRHTFTWGFLIWINPVVQTIATLEALLSSPLSNKTISVISTLEKSL